MANDDLGKEEADIKTLITPLTAMDNSLHIISDELRYLEANSLITHETLVRVVDTLKQSRRDYVRRVLKDKERPVLHGERL
jgi:hypothetical protein